MNEHDLKVAAAQEHSNKVRALLENPVFDLTFANLVEQYTNDWKNSTAGDHEQRELAYVKLTVLADIKADLQRQANNAKFIAHNSRSKLTRPA